MTEVICNSQKAQSLLPRKIILSNINIIKSKRMTKEFNDSFVDIFPQLAN